MLTVASNNVVVWSWQGLRNKLPVQYIRDIFTLIWGSSTLHHLITEMHTAAMFYTKQQIRQSSLINYHLRKRKRLIICSVSNMIIGIFHQRDTKNISFQDLSLAEFFSHVYPLLLLLWPVYASICHLGLVGIRNSTKIKFSIKWKPFLQK
jgi:hypothetical protein